MADIKNEVAVVILNWNGEKYLRQFLPIIVENSSRAIIYVVDNNSSDGSCDFVNDIYPSVKIIRHEKNEGFCSGYNLALQQIEAKYYVLLNSDVEVTKGWINPVIDFMDQNPKVAVCQPKIKSFHKKDHFEYAGAAGGFIDKFGYPFCRGRIFDAIEIDTGQYNTRTDITWASGACFFVRSKVYHDLGGLDELFFAHMEEIDFCWRALNHNFRIAYIPESEVFHVGGGTLQKSNPYKTYLNFRNGLFLLHKNLPSGQLFYKIFIRMILDGIAGMKFLVAGNVGDFLAIIKAHISYYGVFSKLNNKRKNISIKRSDILKPYSIVFEYFVKKKRFFREL